MVVTSENISSFLGRLVFQWTYKAEILLQSMGSVDSITKLQKARIKSKNFLISRSSIEESLLIINLFGMFYSFKYVPINKKEHRHYKKKLQWLGSCEKCYTS